MNWLTTLTSVIKLLDFISGLWKEKSIVKATREQDIATVQAAHTATLEKVNHAKTAQRKRNLSATDSAVDGLPDDGFRRD